MAPTAHAQARCGGHAMDSTTALLVAGVTMFVATHVDDLFITVGLFADRSFPRTAIVAGRYLGTGALFAASVVAASLAHAIPTHLLNWLGLVPIAIGLKLLRDRQRSDDIGDAAPARPSTRALGVAAITIANGGDNLGVYIPVFATHDGHAIALWAAVFVTMTALLCLMAAGLVGHRAWRGPVEAFAARFVPWGLIALGLWILSRLLPV